MALQASGAHRPGCSESHLRHGEVVALKVPHRLASGVVIKFIQGDHVRVEELEDGGHAGRLGTGVASSAARAPAVGRLMAALKVARRRDRPAGRRRVPAKGGGDAAAAAAREGRETTAAVASRPTTTARRQARRDVIVTVAMLS